MIMFSINGTGLRFYGVNQPDQEGKSFATVWFTFFFLPIVPVRRVVLTRKITRPRDFIFTVHAKQKLVWSEVAHTWLWGLILTPLLMFAPLILGAIGIATGILADTPEHSNGFTIAVLLVGIIYLIVFIWKWKDWIDKQGLPKNYNEMLKNARHES
jgi:hypothetical protein